MEETNDNVKQNRVTKQLISNSCQTYALEQDNGMTNQDLGKNNNYENLATNETDLDIETLNESYITKPNLYLNKKNGRKTLNLTKQIRTGSVGGGL